MLALSQRSQQCKHGYLTGREAAKVAKRKSFDPSVQVRVLKTLDISYSHSIVKNYLQFVPVCRSLLQFVLFTPSLKKCRESMGSNLGHGFSGHPRRFCRSRRMGAPCIILRTDEPLGHLEFARIEIPPSARTRRQARSRPLPQALLAKLLQ